MDWIPLIASTARLIDLHDSNRAAGHAASQYDLYRETRGGNHDGLWLDWEKALICTANCIPSEHPFASQLNGSCIQPEQRLHDLHAMSWPFLAQIKKPVTGDRLWGYKR